MFVCISVSWLFGWLVGRLVSKSVGQLVSMSVCFTSHASIRALVYYELPYYEIICSSVRQLVCCLVGKPVGRSVSRSVCRSVSLSMLLSEHMFIMSFLNMSPYVRLIVSWFVALANTGRGGNLFPIYSLFFIYDFTTGTM